MPHKPVELTASARKKLPAALKAKKAGLVGSTKTRQNQKKSQLDDVMKQIKKNRGN